MAAWKPFPPNSLTERRRRIAYVSPEDYKGLTENPFVLGEAPVPLFYGAACQDVNTVGGFANWVQDANIPSVPTAETNEESGADPVGYGV